MRTKITRLLALLVPLLLVAALAGPAAADTTSPTATTSSSDSAAASTRYTMAQARAWLVKKWTSGPNSYTHNQRVQLTGSHEIRNKRGCPTGSYGIDSAVHTYSPAVTEGTVTDDTPSTVTNGTDAVSNPADEPDSGPCPQASPDGLVHPDSWWNPASWDWGHILSATWNKIWNGCIKGAIQYTTATASGTLAVNLLARAGKLVPGPEGYAAVAIGGCVVGLLFN